MDEVIIQEEKEVLKVNKDREIIIEKEHNNNTMSNIVLRDDKTFLENINFEELNKDRIDFYFKILFIGQSGIGKTSLITSYCDKRESASKSNKKNRYIATLNHDYRFKTIQCNNKKIKLKFIDTAGVNKISITPLIEEYIISSHAVIHVVTSNSNKYTGNTQIDKLLKQPGIKYFPVLIGNESVQKETGDIYSVNITDVQSIDNFFNTVMYNMITYYEKNEVLYHNKNLISEDNFFPKYIKKKQKKKCCYC